MKNILLIEDDKALNAFYKAILEDAGYNVLAEYSSKHAMLRLSQFKFDLLITDVIMDDMDGTELVTNIRKCDCPAANIPILVMSSKAFYAEMASEIGQGLGPNSKNEFLIKPFGAEELVLRVKQMINSSMIKG
jgi:DNA-binding response OmpR family regulator